MKYDFTRFLDAQENSYEQALSEIKAGRKSGHWMWYIFPQIKGLGSSETSRYYSIQSLEEAKYYLMDPVLGARLKKITSVLLQLREHNANKVFGYPDDMKLKSCMTLFALADTSEEKLFGRVLDKFFNGQSDDKTLARIKE